MISILIPTRGRPEAMREITTSALSLAENPNQIEIFFYIDADDDASLKMAQELQAPNIRHMVGPRVFLSVAWNILASQATHEIYSPIGDDARFRTQNWDTKIKAVFNEYPDKIVHVYAKDGIQNKKLGTQAFVHRNWITTTGYLLPPYFFSDFTDTWLTEVGKRIKRSRYLPDVFVEHLHPAGGHVELDKTHKERLARINPLSLKLFGKLKFLRKEDAKKLKAFISAYPKS